MNSEDIMRMAREAGFENNRLGWTYTQGYLAEHLEQFAALVAAAEREACKRRNETKERIRKLAEQAGIDDVLVPRDVIEKFAALVATDENEACWQACKEVRDSDYCAEEWAEQCMDKIRARGNK